MIDAWDDNLKQTSELKRGLNEHSDKLKQHNDRIFELEKRINDFALKVDVD